MLVTHQIVTAQQLLEAIERQQKMPLVRIGEALLSLGMIDEGQLKEALVQQQLDRSIPLGEILVRMGVVSRDELQTALARKMGYPLVDLEAFPVETEALRKLGYGVAARLRAIPLLIRDGRLVVALEDPSRRAAVDEIEFNSELKVVPVLGRSIHTTLHAAYDKIGSGGKTRVAADLAAPIAYEPDFSAASAAATTSTDELVETL
jgi:hypothetical protein